MDTELTLHKKLNIIQQELKVAKNQRNTFGNYNYRSCEDILEAVKPLLNGCTLTLEDEVVNVGTKNYVRAVALFTDGKTNISTTAYAREAEDKKGMDDAQITGAASSYARKYALNGLFAIDDTKDSDTMDNTEKQAASPAKPAQIDTQTIQPTKCPTCYAIGKIHAPNCPNNPFRTNPDVNNPSLGAKD